MVIWMWFLDTGIEVTPWYSLRIHWNITILSFNTKVNIKSDTIFEYNCAILHFSVDGVYCICCKRSKYIVGLCLYM